MIIKLTVKKLYKDRKNLNYLRGKENETITRYI